MNLISLNCWGGKIKEPLLEFVQAKKETTDIFCFQEVFNGGQDHPLEKKEDEEQGITWKVYNLLPLLKKILDDTHDSYFQASIDDYYGLATFVRKGVKVRREGAKFVHKEKNYTPEGDLGNHARIIQYLEIENSGKPITVVNFHGLWNGGGKGDAPERITQSERILEITKIFTTPYFITGDYNLSPDTQSLKILEDSGLRNLVKKYGITSTRTSYYTKENKFADYILVSEGVGVEDFKVLPDEVSDHAALYFEFN